MLNSSDKLFGTVLKTRVLMAIAMLEETFPAEICRVINSRLFPVQRALDSLEGEGIIVSRKPGVERRVSINPRYFASSELKALLRKIAMQDQPLMSALSQLRTRPRRRGKIM
jgi:hypothetical protein